MQFSVIPLVFVFPFNYCHRIILLNKNYFYPDLKKIYIYSVAKKYHRYLTKYSAILFKNTIDQSFKEIKILFI